MKLFILMFFVFESLFGIVSVKPMEIGEQKGTHGNVGLSFETKRGNTIRDNYKASAKLSYDHGEDYLSWAEISGEYGATAYNEDTNKLYAHLRYIRAITKESVRGEAFFQIQEDKFRLIQNRTLLGGGGRFKIFELFKDAKGYFGLGGFYEYMAYSDSSPVENNFRVNSYFTYTMKFNTTSNFTYSFLVQPKIDDFSDYVDSHRISLEIMVYKELYLNFQLTYENDTKPVPNVENYDFSQTTAFVYKF
ncbi:MAG: DUF481 domain-containing protein [Campylobacterales bacterium]|nr:DUF481 domain-containing protein [Campylobacterales bacterium]